jgi:hypothetical protein
MISSQFKYYRTKLHQTSCLPCIAVEMIYKISTQIEFYGLLSSGKKIRQPLLFLGGRINNILYNLAKYLTGLI